MFWETLAKEVQTNKLLRETRQVTPNTRHTHYKRLPGLWVKFYSTQLGPLYFTGREVQCTKQLLKGRSIQEIAKRMRLSPRTIEYYLKNVREKTCCNSKLELLKLMEHSTLTNNKPSDLDLL